MSSPQSTTLRPSTPFIIVLWVLFFGGIIFNSFRQNQDDDHPKTVSYGADIVPQVSINNLPIGTYTVVTSTDEDATVQDEQYSHRYVTRLRAEPLGNLLDLHHSCPPRDELEPELVIKVTSQGTIFHNTP